MRVFLALLVLFVAPPLCAQSNPPECESVRTTQEINGCALAEVQQTEVEMEDVFATLMAKMRRDAGFVSAGLPVKLEDTQRAWRAYRANQCDFAGTATLGGTGSAAVHLGCMTRLNRERAAEPRLFLD
jgi:uncharacterized protein YecT (DUF1311 family)